MDMKIFALKLVTLESYVSRNRLYNHFSYTRSFRYDDLYSTDVHFEKFNVSYKVAKKKFSLIQHTRLRFNYLFTNYKNLYYYNTNFYNSPLGKVFFIKKIIFFIKRFYYPKDDSMLGLNVIQIFAFNKFFTQTFYPLFLLLKKLFHVYSTNVNLPENFKLIFNTVSVVPLRLRSVYRFLYSSVYLSILDKWFFYRKATPAQRLIFDLNHKTFNKALIRSRRFSISKFKLRKSVITRKKKVLNNKFVQLKLKVKARKTFTKLIRSKKKNSYEVILKTSRLSGLLDTYSRITKNTDVDLYKDLYNKFQKTRRKKDKRTFLGRRWDRKLYFRRLRTDDAVRKVKIMKGRVYRILKHPHSKKLLRHEKKRHVKPNIGLVRSNNKVYASLLSVNAISNFNYLLTEKKLLPNLQTYFESAQLFDMDSSNNSSYNLSLNSAPDFFWDEWDADFLNQQNGLLSTEDMTDDDDFYGEERLTSYDLNLDYDPFPSLSSFKGSELHNPSKFFKNRRLAKLLNIYKYESAIRTSKPAMTKSYDYFFLFDWDDQMNNPSHEQINNITDPDLEGVPIKDKFLPVLGVKGSERVTDIPVGDGPINFDVGDDEDWEFYYEGVHDQTLLYDWYTLQRVNSKFSNRVAGNRFNKYVGIDTDDFPYQDTENYAIPASMLSCSKIENYFHREFFERDGERWLEDLRRWRTLKISVDQLDEDRDSFRTFSAFSKVFNDTVKKINFSFRQVTPVAPSLRLIDKNSTKTFLKETEFQAKALGRSYYYSERTLNRRFNAETDNQKSRLINTSASINHSTFYQPIQGFYFFGFLASLSVVISIILSLFIAHPTFSFLFTIRDSAPFTYWDPFTYEPEILTRHRTLEHLNYPWFSRLKQSVSRPVFGFIADYFPNNFETGLDIEDNPIEKYAKWARDNEIAHKKYRSKVRKVMNRHQPPDEVPPFKAIRLEAAKTFIERLDKAKERIAIERPHTPIKAREYELSEKELKEVLSYDEARQYGLLRTLPKPKDLRYEGAYKFLREHLNMLDLIDWISNDYFWKDLVALEEWFEEENERRKEAEEELLVWDIPEFDWDHYANWFDIQTTLKPTKEGAETQIVQTDEHRKYPNKPRRKKPRTWRGTEYLEDFDEFLTHGDHPLIFKEPIKNQYSSIPRDIERSKKPELIGQKWVKSPFDYRSELLRRRPRLDPERNSETDFWFTKNLSHNKAVRKYFNDLSHRSSYEYLLNSNSGSYGLANQHSRRDLYYSSQLEKRDAQHIIRRTGSTDFEWVGDVNFLKPYIFYDILFNPTQTAHFASGDRPSLSSMSWFLRLGTEMIGKADHLAAPGSTIDMQIRDFETYWPIPFKFFEKKVRKYFDGTYLYWYRPRYYPRSEITLANDVLRAFAWHLETDKDSLLLDQVRVYQPPFNLGYRGSFPGHLYWEPYYDETTYLNLAQDNRLHQQYEEADPPYHAVPGYEPLLEKLELENYRGIYSFPVKDKFDRYWDEQPKKALLVKEALIPVPHYMFDEDRDGIITEVWLPVFDRKTGEEVSFLKSGRDVRRSSMESRRWENYYTLFYQKYSAITTVDPISMRAQLPPVEFPVDKVSEVYAHNARRAKYEYIPMVGIDPNKFNDFANVGYNPLFKLFRIPIGPINRDILTLSDKNDTSQLYRWLVLLNSRTNLYDYSKSITVIYEDHFFHKAKTKALNVNRVFFHPASDVDMTLVFNIPSLWENYYNARWLKNLPSFFRLTTSSDQNYHVNSYIGYDGLYFYERLLIDLAKNTIDRLLGFTSFWRLLFIFVGLIYIFNKPYLYLKHMYAKTRLFSFNISQTEVSRNSLYLSNRLYSPGSTSSARSYNLKVFNMFVFKLPLKKFKRLNNYTNLSYKYQFPERYNEGARSFDNKTFLQRPKSLETQIINLSRKSCTRFNFYKTPVAKSDIAINSLTRFGAYSYSFLWAMPPIKKIKTRYKKRRSFFFHKVSRNFMKKISYRKYIQKQYLKPTQNVFFVKQSLPYILDRTTNLTNLVVYPEVNVKKQRLAIDFFFLCEEEEMEDRELLNDTITRANINEYEEWYFERPMWSDETEADLTNETHTDEFKTRRELWSKLRGTDRRNSILLRKYKTLDPLFLEIYTRQLNMKSYSSNNLVVSLLTDPTISQSPLLDIALKDLHAHYYQPAMLDDSKNTGPIVELEDDDFGGFDLDNFDNKEEDFTDSLQLVADWEDVEDDFESVFMDLVYSVTPENALVEVTLSSLLLDKTFKNVDMNPLVANDNFLVRSELVNYKMWRTHKLDNYILAVPTQDITIDDISIGKTQFSINSPGLPIQYSVLFLVPYSLPRFLVRLDKLSTERYKVKNTLRLSTSESDIYDNGFHTALWRLKHFRGSINDYRRPRARVFARPFKKYYTKSDLIKPIESTLQPFLKDSIVDSALSESHYNYESFENSKRNLVQQKLDPYSGEFMYKNIVSFFAEDLNSAIKTFVNDDSNEHVQSYHIENNEDADQIFPSTDFYRWRFLSLPYLNLLRSRPKEFILTQTTPFIDYGRYETYLVAENFNYKSFVEPLSCYKFTSSDALDSDLISEWLSHSLTDFNETWQINKIIDLLFTELHPDEENSIDEDEMYDDDEEDEFEDDFEFQQSHYKFDNETQFGPIFTIFMKLMLRDVTMNPSLQTEIVKQETSTARAVSEAITYFTESLRATGRRSLSGLTAFPAITEIDDEEDETTRQEKGQDSWLLKLEKLRLAKRDTESLSVHNDMEDTMIPILTDHVLQTFYEGYQPVFTDTIEKYLGRIQPEILERYVSELKAVRRDLISKNVEHSPFLNFSDINVVSPKDLLVYIIAIKSPYIGNLFYSNSWAPMANIESNSIPEGIMDELDFLEDLLDEFLSEEYDLKMPFTKSPTDISKTDELADDLVSLAYDKLLVESPALRFIVLSSLYFNDFEAEYTTYS